MTDNEIIAAMQTDIHAGFPMLVKAYTEPVYWHIRRMVVSFDDTQDVAQETFLRIYRSFGSFRGDCKLSSWIYRIATNEALRFIERREARPSAASEGDFDAVADEYVDLSDNLSVELQRAIHTLPPKQQAVFNLRYFNELDYAEIAEIVGSTASSAKSSYHIAKEKIKEYILNTSIR